MRPSHENSHLADRRRWVTRFGPHPSWLDDHGTNTNSASTMHTGLSDPLRSMVMRSLSR